MVTALFVNKPGGGWVESVLTRATHRLLFPRRIFCLALGIGTSLPARNRAGVFVATFILRQHDRQSLSPGRFAHPIQAMT